MECGKRCEEALLEEEARPGAFVAIFALDRRGKRALRSAVKITGEEEMPGVPLTRRFPTIGRNPPDPAR